MIETTDPWAGSLSTALTLIEAAATAAFALSGVLAAARKGMDAVGVVTVAGVAAFGGGTLRDVLLDRRPFFWVEHTVYVWMVLALAVAAMVFLRARHFQLTEKAMQWPDALGLGLFAASGTQLALANGMPGLVAVLMGVFTAVFGGVLRDVICNDVPAALSDHRPYALCAVAGAVLVVVFYQVAGLPEWLPLLSGAALASCLRLMALKWNWRLKRWSPDTHV
jgi:uncharacterized membrane protein YeiH